MFKKTEPEWLLDGITAPDGVAFLDHVERLLPGTGRGPLPNAGEPLPDTPPKTPNAISWSAGSMDGVLGHHFGGRGKGNEPIVAAAAVIDLLRNKPDSRRVVRAVDRLSAVQGPQQVDRMIESLAESRHLDRARLATFARWLCEHGTRRELIKNGMALLGFAGTSKDAELVTRLGLLEELTLFAVVALQNLLAEPELAIFELAQQVEGWGRVQAVQRLDGSTDARIRSWLLRGGAENAVMTEYLALIAARTGGLREALEAGADGDLLEHAGELLRALATGGPVEAMEGYEDAAAAMLSYLLQIQDAPLTLDLLGILNVLDRYAKRDPAEHPQINDDQRASIIVLIEAALARHGWADLIRANLASEDKHTSWRAISHAAQFGIDAEPVVRSQLSRSPYDQFLWQWLLLRADATQLRAIIDEMVAVLPLDALSTGPGEDMGLGPGYEAEGCLGQVLQRITQLDVPGAGWPLVRVGLNNRVVRNRNIALLALEKWPRESWPPEAIELLRALQFREPNEKTRKKVSELLKPD